MSTDIVKIEMKASGLGHTEVIEAESGLSLGEIIYHYGHDPDECSVFVRSNNYTRWELVHKEHIWNIVPKSSEAEPNWMVCYPLHGGGGKSVFGIIAGILLAAIAGPLATFLFSSFGTFAVALGTAAIIAGGSYAIGQIFPPEAPKQKSITDDTPDSGSFTDSTTDRNILAYDAFPPVVLGKRKVFPPESCNPLLYLRYGQQVIERNFVFGGRTKITDVRNNGGLVSDDDQISVQVIEGDETDPTLTIASKISAFTDVSTELSNFDFSDDGITLINQSDPSRSDPNKIRFITKGHERLEELIVRWRMSGFYKTTNPSSNVSVTVRVRARNVDQTTWVNYPEIIRTGNSTTPVIVELKSRWDNDFEFKEVFPGGGTPWSFIRQVPAPTVPLSSGLPATVQWTAHSHFFGAGGAITDVDNIEGVTDGVLAVLTTSMIDPTKDVEWEIQRGCCVESLVMSSYTISGVVYPLFEGRSDSGTHKVAVNQQNFPVQLGVNHAVSVADVRPVLEAGHGQISIIGRDVNLKGISCIGEGYVRDYTTLGAGGVSPDNFPWELSNNPAVIYTHYLREFLTDHQISVDLIDYATMLAWKQECDNRGYTVNCVIAGESLFEVLSICASAGYAIPTITSGFAVQWFRDRSAELPLFPISMRNTSSITTTIENAELPTEIRVTYANADKDWDSTKPVIVNNPIDVNFTGVLSKESRGLTNSSDVEKQEIFQLLQMFYRNKAYVCEMNYRRLACSVGDLVLLVDPTLARHSIGTRVSKVVDPMTLIVDDEFTRINGSEFFSITNVLDDNILPNLFDVEGDNLLFTTTPDGQEMLDIDNVDGRTIRLKSPLTNSDIEGTYVITGPVAMFAKRCIVSRIEASSEKSANVILVDEAPEVWDEMQRIFN